MASNNNMLQPQLPRLTGKNYNQWSIQMKVLYGSQDLWEIVENGYEEPENQTNLSTQQLNTLKENRKKDKKALYFIYQSVDEVIFERISMASTSKEAWDILNKTYKGEEKVKMVRLQALRGEFDSLKMKESETVEEYYNRTISIVNQLRVNGEDITDKRVLEKILRSMTRKFEHVVVAIEESKDLNTFSLEELLGSLQSHELRIKQFDSPSEQAFQVQDTNRGGFRGRGGRGSFRGRGQGRGKVPSENSSSYQRGRGRARGGYNGRGRGNSFNFQCHYCHKNGHMKKDCYKRINDEKDESNFLHENVEEKDESMLLVSNVQEESLEDVWYIDSGCSNHMTGNKNCFVNFDESVQREVKTGDNKRLIVKGCGDIPIRTKQGTNYISNVYYVPDLKHNLLSVGQLTRKGHHVNFKDDFCVIKDKNGDLVARVKMTSTKMFPLKIQSESLPCFANIVNDKSWLWHLRYNHLSFSTLSKICKGHMVRGIPNIQRQDQVCEDCIFGKHHRDPFPKEKAWRAKKPLELIHSDLCGPMRTNSIGGSRYFLTFIDDYSRKMWIYFLKEKSQVFETFKVFKAYVEKESGHSLKTLRSDRGGEYMSQEFESFLKKHGIRHQLTVRSTPQQNGVAERKNRIIMELVRSMLKTKGLPKMFWAEAVSCACYVLNRAPNKSVQGKTPQEAWSRKKPCVSHFRIFGSICYSHVPDEKRGKLDDKSEKCIFVGYSEASKAYKLYNPITKKVIISRDVIFNEEASWEWKNEKESSSIFLDNDAFDPIEEEGSTPPTPPSNSPPSSSSSSSYESPPRKTRSMADLYGATRRILEDEFVDFALYANADPVAFEDAAKENKWRKAMDQEIEAIERNQTWELVKAPKEKKPIGVKWVYKTKLNAQGEVEKHKARLVVKGYKQKYGVDYKEVFAPVARLETIRLILSLAAQNKWQVHQMDVKSAFLNGELQEEVYIDQPPGYVKKNEENKVYRLKKALYGLKQAPRAWYSRIDDYFVKMGFKRCPFEHTLYIKENKGKILIIGLYVDDLIFTGNNDDDIEEFKNNMMQEFEMTDLGLLHYFLGIEVKQDENGIFISQEKYARDLMKKFRMEDAKPSSTPVEVGLKLSEDDDSKFVDPTLYRSLVGSLMYLTATRPDITYGVSLISRFMEQPKRTHWEAGKRILRYVRGTLGDGIYYQKANGTKVIGYCDSDWAGSIDDSKSTSGNVFFVGSSAITWMSKKQQVVALSTAEAEYISLSLASCQALWITWVLEYLKHATKESPTIYCDNKSAIALTENPVFHGKSKHIRIKYHFIRDLVKKGEVVVEHCKTQDQIGDIFTKPLRPDIFKKLRKKLGMCKV